MTMEDKELLLKDLCARLPYDVKVQSYSYEDDVETVETLYEINSIGYTATLECDTLKNIHKPYLFPLSSMTEEQKNEYQDIIHYINTDDTDNWAEGEFIYIDRCNNFGKLLHFYNRHHLDWRGLISKGLAIDATGLNIY